ncbi:DUF222 domain-containing protein [Arthrobacter alpinus]|nr:DUF222 domain-containing protein [Arthrobacter alpinus]
MAAQAAGASSDTPGAGSTFGVDVGAMSDRESRQWSQDLEKLLRYGHALAVQSAGDQDQRASAGRYAETGATSSVALLVQSLHLSATEASRRIHLAKQVLPNIDTITGAIAPTSHPALSQALFNGTLSQERALTISHYLEEATRLAGNGRITEEENTEVEEFLVNAAASQGPDSIRHLGNRIMANLDPDGNKPSTADLKAKQGLFFRQARRGLVSIHGACTIEQYEQLIALIGFTTNPNKHTNIDTLNNDSNEVPDQGKDASPKQTSTMTATAPVMAAPKTSRAAPAPVLGQNRNALGKAPWSICSMMPRRSSAQAPVSVAGAPVEVTATATPRPQILARALTFTLILILILILIDPATHKSHHSHRRTPRTLEQHSRARAQQKRRPPRPKQHRHRLTKSPLNLQNQQPNRKHPRPDQHIPCLNYWATDGDAG